MASCAWLPVELMGTKGLCVRSAVWWRMGKGVIGRVRARTAGGGAVNGKPLTLEVGCGGRGGCAFDQPEKCPWSIGPVAPTIPTKLRAFVLHPGGATPLTP